jgi:hypothetical protein
MEFVIIGVIMLNRIEREILLRITARHFVAGAIFQIQLSRWICVRAAPILKYMVGWNSKKAKDYCLKKGWETEVLKD